MTDKYEAPFEGGKTPDPAATAKTKNRAKNLARRAMKKAAVKESAPERPYRRVYEPTSAQELNPGLRAKIDAASNAQKPRPMSGMRPIGKIKLMTREEVELDEEFINGREYAAHGLMHPKHAMQAIHQPSDRYVDFYASGTGDKMSGKVKSNNGKVVHIQAHPKMGDGKLHTFKVTTDLPKMTNEAKDEGEYDYEGDMAMSQLKSVITNAQKLHDMLEPNTNLPEWVQSKITLAEDYIVTAANYMDGEMNEEVEQVEEGLVGSLVKAYISPKAQRLVGKGVKKVVGKLGASAQTQRRLQKVGMNWAKSKIGEEAEQIDELSKKTLSSYVGKAYWDQGKRIAKAGQAYGYIAATERRKATHGEISNAIGGKKEARRDKSRDKGVERALARLAKEDVEHIKEKKMGYEKLASAIKSRVAKKKLAVEATDPVGKEDADINNDGKTDKTDVYLHTKRRAIGKAIGTRLATKAGK